MILRGRCSWFGGPEDKGVSPSEGLAFIYQVSDAPHLFLPAQPPGTTGLARRLDPEVFFLATRWDYAVYPKPSLLEHMALVRAPKTGREYLAYPADWGPHQDTDRVADISKGLMDALGIETDDEVEVTYPYGEQPAVKPMPYPSIAISSGHGLYVRGASGVGKGGFDEVDEARRLVDRVADELDARGVSVSVYHDNWSKTQSENLGAITNWHNGVGAALDVSCHFNAFDGKAHGTEVLYLTQPDLAAEMSAAIATAGQFTNRGGKKRTDLAFLNKTKAPAILLETCFCDSSADAKLYKDRFSQICDAIADVLGGPEMVVKPPSQPPEVEVTTPRVDIQVTGDVLLYVNGKLMS